MRRILEIFLATAVLALLAACGGGGSGGGGNVCLAANCGSTSSSSSSSSGGATVASLSLTVSSPTLSTNGSSTITVRAVAKDASNGGVSGATINVSADSGTLSASSGTTDSSGVLSVAFDSNDNKTNRVVTLKATVNGLNQQSTINVAGTNIKFSSGATAAVAGVPVTLVLTATDAGSNPIAGTAIALTSSLKNSVPATVTTDSTGTAKITYTPTNAGSDVITAAGLGAVATETVTISSVNFSFSSPTANIYVPLVNLQGNINCQQVTVGGSGFSTAPQNILFTATRGTLHASPDCSDSPSQISQPFVGGSALAYISSSSSGSSTVTAAALDASSNVLAQTQLPLVFIATVPASLTVQASPSTVSVNGTSTISAVVRDAKGNAVTGATVIFATDVGGQVSPTTATTDLSGTAYATFTADSSITGTGAVKITGTLQGGTLINTTALTVSGLAVNIVLGTDNLLAEVGSPLHYRLTYGASVTDSNGSPVANKAVTVSIRGTRFYKGRWCSKYDAGATTGLCTIASADQTNWVRAPAAPTGGCPAEDTNNNGVIDPGEPGDVNGSGLYEPDGAATVLADPNGSGANQITVTTNAAGFATFYVDYFEKYGSWVDVELKATASVYGNNAYGVVNWGLGILSTQWKNQDVGWPWIVSPFGQADGCNNTN